LCCHAHDSSQVLWRQELGDRHGSGHDAEEAVGLLLIVAQGREELLHLRWRRLQRRELACELVERQRRLVAPLLDDEAFIALLAEQNIFCLPGAVVELPGYFRISLTANDTMIEQALPGFAIALQKATRGR
jgi:hypothetical protein